MAGDLLCAGFKVFFLFTLPSEHVESFTKECWCTVEHLAQEKYSQIIVDDGSLIRVVIRVIKQFANPS